MCNETELSNKKQSLQYKKFNVHLHILATTQPFSHASMLEKKVHFTQETGICGAQCE